MAVKSKSSNIKQEAEGTAATVDDLLNRFPKKINNVLKDFESVTYKISLGACDKRAYNEASYVDPDGQDPRWIVLGESGYTGTKQTGEKSGSSGDIGSRAPAGNANIPEYFIDQFNFLTNMPGSGQTPNGNTGMAGGSFEVFEPYSMGQFFESLMSSAILAGYSHFIQTPYIIKVEFHGWQEGSAVTVDTATRYIPILLQNITFDADESGSKYTVSFMQAGDAMSVNDFTLDIGNSISFAAGRSPQTALTNLADAMNKKQQEDIKSAKVKTLEDEYVISIINGNITDGGELIQWPEEPQWETFLSDPEKLKNVSGLETVNLKFGNNSIPNSKDSGTIDARFVYNSTTDKKLDLLTVINDVMCHTTIATQAAKNANADADIVYFTVEKRAYYINEDGPPDALSGKFPKRFVYTVRPYKTKLDKTKMPTQEVKMTSVTTETIRKVYSYTYTGQNDDIITYKLNFNSAFFLAGNHAGWEDIAENNAKLLNTEKITWVKPSAGRSDVFLSLVPGGYPMEPDKNAFPNVPGGIGIDATELNVARWVNANITGLKGDPGKDDKQNLYQLEVDLTILGDPYFIPTAGLGNQKYLPDSAAWEGQDVRVYLRFRNIQDYPYPGSNLPIVPTAGIDHPFSGVYKVLLIKNRFQEGVFTQGLTLVKDLTIDPEIKSQIEGATTGGQAASDTVGVLLGQDMQSREDLQTYDIKNIYKKGDAE